MNHLSVILDNQFPTDFRLATSPLPQRASLYIPRKLTEPPCKPTEPICKFTEPPCKSPEPTCKFTEVLCMLTEPSCKLLEPLRKRPEPMGLTAATPCKQRDTAF